jgi:hypothetical protein
MPCSRSAFVDEPRASEHHEVLGDGWLRDVEVAREISNRPLPPA